jgi:exosortase/archaeosortase family protein
LLSLKKASWGHWSLGLLSALLVAIFYFTAEHVQQNPGLAVSQFWQYFLLLHAVFLAMFVFLGFAVFGGQFVKNFFLDFRKELLICLGIGIVFYAVMQLVWQSWRLLSFGVSHLVYWMLLLFPGSAVLELPRTIVVGQFAVEIGESCSGVFSIFLFTCLYLLIIALDWKQLKGWKVAVLFPLAVIGLYLANVLRVYLIVLVGVFYSPPFAVNLFHSYIGTILFLAFFVGFLWLTYDWMKQ